MKSRLQITSIGVTRINRFSSLPCTAGGARNLTGAISRADSRIPRNRKLLRRESARSQSWAEVFYDYENQPGKEAVAVITHSLWQRRFGGDPNIINKTIALNGIIRTVVGVMPERFNFPKGAEVYAPLGITPELSRSRQSHSYYVIGRLKPGRNTPSRAIGNRHNHFSTRTTVPRNKYRSRSERLSDRQRYVRQYDTALWIMMAAVGFVLLIACANVAKPDACTRNWKTERDCLESRAGCRSLENHPSNC
jgi:hypothetical protein